MTLNNLSSLDFTGLDFFFFVFLVYSSFSFFLVYVLAYNLEFSGKTLQNSFCLAEPQPSPGVDGQ